MSENKGNPHFMQGLRDRRSELLRRLNELPKEGWSQAMALFAMEYNLTETTVSKYFILLKKAGLLK